MALVAIADLPHGPRVSPDRTEQFFTQFRVPQHRERTREFFGAMFPAPGTKALRGQVLSEMLATHAVRHASLHER